MRQLFITSNMLAMATMSSLNAQNQQSDFYIVKACEDHSAVIMELIDITGLQLKSMKLKHITRKTPTKLTRYFLPRTGLNLLFFSETVCKNIPVKKEALPSRIAEPQYAALNYT
ncbi:hypothetical protein QWZ08_19985 [Ferruginibacter paludis]|uniref:hypothetical protein n=1 Tax=Ferruginibacter paludis TaxID=1310417 RepID=UPI0025B3B95D|nr:hypothetical protein [Ferruginibacter paludis]MDN3657944.1 hypothetical protein [Ferruginibacter paludis]